MDERDISNPESGNCHHEKFHIQWRFILPADERRAEGTVTNSTVFAKGLDNHGEGVPGKSKNRMDTLL